VVDIEIESLLGALPALWLDGPKAVGKTSTALQRAATVRRLDRAAEREIVAGDLDRALGGHRPVLFDEWQRLPEVWDAVKTAVDTDTTPGHYLLTGSAATGTHSGAGRIKAVRMRPLTLPERRASNPTISLRRLFEGPSADVEGASDMGLSQYTDEVLRSGLPAFQRLDGQALRAGLEGYLERIVDVDMEEAGLKVRRADAVTAWLRAYGAATATTTSWEKIRDAATPGAGNKPAKTTVLPYIDVLKRLRILDELDAWIPGHNHLKRLGQAPKHHLADPALAVQLLGLTREDLLAGQTGAVDFPRDGTFLGALFESLCAMSVRVFAQACESRVSHLRTTDGLHEVDLIVARGPRILAFEVKLSATVIDEDVRHLLWLRDRIGRQLVDAAVLNTGPEAYRRRDGIAVIPLALLGP
jgi:predicted AAA+ superfamily ATPase